MWYYCILLFIGVLLMSPFVVRITDEFLSVFTLEAQTKAQAINIVNMWLENIDSTPIQEIVIEINEIN
jgi:hypothetical protein